MADFEVRIATGPREIEQAQRLRFEVFNLELNKGLRSSYDRGLDVDEFDPYCDHLIVRDVRSADVVGTYRLLRGSAARRNIGFYSEKEFELSRIKELDGEPTADLAKKAGRATHEGVGLRDIFLELTGDGAAS